MSLHASFEKRNADVDERYERIIGTVTVQPTPFAKRTYGASPLLRSYFCS